MQLGHLRAVWKLLEYSQPEGQALLDLGALLPVSELLQLLYILIQFQIIQNHSYEE